MPYKEFSAFLQSKFSKGSRKVDGQVLEEAFQIAENIPGDVQQLCGALWEIIREKEVINIDTLKRAVELRFAREQKSYESYLRLLTNIHFNPSPLTLII